MKVGGIHDVASANLLAPDAISLEADGISLFYGPNGSGKTGYVRLLRCLFRARGYDSVLPNVFLEDAGTPRATITLSYGAVTEPVTWDAATDADLELTGAAIFDESASSTYLSGDTQVWYTPSGLDVLNSLATVMDWVQEQLIRERKGATSELLAFPDEVLASAVGAQLETLSADSTLRDVDSLTSFPAESRQRLGELLTTLTVPAGIAWAFCGLVSRV